MQYTFKYVRENMKTKEVSPVSTSSVEAIDEKDAWFKALIVINSFNQTVKSFKYWYVE